MSIAFHQQDEEQEPLVFPEGYMAEYLAEGAANIVYRIIAPPGTLREDELNDYGPDTPLSSEYETPYNPFEGFLLRLRKALPTTQPAQVTQYDFKHIIMPLLPATYVIPQTLICIPSTLISTLNLSLKNAEVIAQRPAKRHGVYLAEDKYGLCIQDMTPQPGEALLEFKPKWLAQSPSAPEGSVRCRTCARRDREWFLDGKGGYSNKNGGKTKAFCPLELLSADQGVLEAVAQRIVGTGVKTGSETDNDDTSTDSDTHTQAVCAQRAHAFATWLRTNRLLHDLRDLQVRLDTHGVFEADTDNASFLSAMTLRDCAVFVRFSSQGNNTRVDVRIGDLDLKSALKSEYWRDCERVLCDEGWYAGRKEIGEGRRGGGLCVLSRPGHGI